MWEIGGWVESSGFPSVIVVLALSSANASQNAL